MERDRPDITLNVERRAAEATVGVPPAGPAEVREPFRRLRRDIGDIGRTSPGKSANEGLTRRERRVKDLLLRELKKGSDVRLLSYDEVQNLEKTLNVEWIDRRLEKMRSELKTVPWVTRLAGIFYTVFGLVELPAAIADGGISLGISVAWLALGIGLAVVAPLKVNRSIRRKIFIYEALRELAGVDEAGVALSRAVRDADKLIERIVDLELAAEAEKPAKSIGRVRVR